MASRFCKPARTKRCGPLWSVRLRYAKLDRFRDMHGRTSGERDRALQFRADERQVRRAKYRSIHGNGCERQSVVTYSVPAGLFREPVDVLSILRQLDELVPRGMAAVRGVFPNTLSQRLPSTVCPASVQCSRAEHLVPHY